MCSTEHSTHCAFSPESVGCLKRDYPFDTIHFSSRNGRAQRITNDAFRNETCPQMSAEKRRAGGPLSELFEILSHEYRRRILMAVAQHNPQDDDITSEAVADEHEGDAGALGHLNMQLYHTHLPKLAGSGFVDWDRDSGTVTRGPRFEEIEPLLRLIHDHQNELPDDWP